MAATIAAWHASPSVYALRPGRLLRGQAIGNGLSRLTLSSQRFYSGRVEHLDEARAVAMAASDIERLIRAPIPGAEVTIQDLADDRDHYKATVIAESFRGKSRAQQHQIVYEALKAEMGGRLHALALQTGAPER
jgi:stress-induced morphogen